MTYAEIVFQSNESPRFSFVRSALFVEMTVSETMLSSRAACQDQEDWPVERPLLAELKEKREGGGATHRPLLRS